MTEKQDAADEKAVHEWCCERLASLKASFKTLEIFCTFVQSGLRLKLGELKKLQWIELLEVSSPLTTLEMKAAIIGTKRKPKLGRKPTALAETGDDDGEEAVDVEDDFKREMPCKQNGYTVDINCCLEVIFVGGTLQNA